ncbi:hypothetical protein [Actinomadura alba]|uniref:Lipoprotein n=1 Tax=Actinomadura alba TaxID=406431 RepID=A0ABR7LVJ2_9ACTN|nr:hypothetical protein [Actinomadura alba]MBC6468816.1 hypothetical protein [Actinomadura alba]
MNQSIKCFVAAVAISLSGSLVSACGGDSSDAEGKGEGNAKLSLASVRGSWQEAKVLRQAEEQLMTQCMKAKGQKYIASPIPDSEPKWDSFGRWNTVEPGDDVQRARRTGYNFQDFQARQKSTPPDLNGAYLKTLSPTEQQKWDLAIKGDKTVKVSVPGSGEGERPAGGCYGDIQKQLYGDLNKWYQAQGTIDMLAGPVGALVAQDQQTRRVEDDWPKCMATKGYRYKHPRDAQSEGFKLAERGSKDKEIKLAVAAAECDKQVGFTSTMRNVWDSHQAKVIADREGQIIAYRTLRMEALKRAHSVLRNS